MGDWDEPHREARTQLEEEKTKIQNLMMTMDRPPEESGEDHMQTKRVRRPAVSDHLSLGLAFLASSAEARVTLEEELG